MVRAGRLSNEERLVILEKIGKEAEKRYRQNLRNTGFKKTWFNIAFQFAPDPINFDNDYMLDTGSEHLNRILQWLEYGTGLYGSRKRMIQSSKTSPKTGNKLLLKFKVVGAWVYKRKVKGIKPGFMFTKAVESVRNEHTSLMRRFRMELNI